MKRSPTQRRILHSIAACLALILAWSCLQSTRSDVSPQEWWKGRGPVVPHDAFPSDCSLCHEGEGWHSIRADFEFDHLGKTGYPLDGAHARAECLRCHNDRGPVAQYTRRGCVGCHEDEHQGNQGASCADCHDENDWRPDEIIANHSSTRFPLVGSHAAVACWRCHEGALVGRFTPTDSECITCHGSDLVRAEFPPHVQNGWISDCDRCHISTTWKGAGFNHPGFPLTGAHKTADCISCHSEGIWAGLPKDCFSCHTAEYQATSDPDHLAFGFPTDCEQCHGTVRWEDGFFNHAGVTTGCALCHLEDFNRTTDPDHAAEGFPMDCELCHRTTQWEGAHFSHAGITTGCADCHLDDFNGTTDPDHVAEGFPMECELCHGTNQWDGANFSHAGITTGCVNCHLDEYTGTTNPNHSSAGFPTQCELCHVSARWVPSTFDHDFPLNSGPHSNRDCTDCHLGNAYPNFSCTHCHDHRQSKMDDVHSDENGYVWQSNACYSCHPNGR